MAERGLPPYPTTEDWRAWATQLVDFLSSQARSEEFVAPRVLSLLHQRDPLLYRALTDGLMMYSSSLGVPVYSKDGEWKQFTSQGDLNYLVTDDAGNGTVVDDINNTDFTGQSGAVGTCAQCPVATNTSFYHKGIQYLYTGPTPASYGLGCADTMQDSYLIPVGAGTFLALTDTPNDYTGSANLWPRVNPAETALIFDAIQEEDITDLDRVRWRGSWVQQTYPSNDMVLDGSWTMISNKTTADRAAPQEDGAPEYDVEPTFITQSFNGVVQSGRAWQTNEPVTVLAYQVWVPSVDPSINYVIRKFSYPVGRPEDVKYEEISEPILVPNDWTTVEAPQTIITTDTVFGLVLNSLNSGGDTLITGGWSRAANSNSLTADPGVGAWGTNNAETSLRINYTDLDTTDRTSEIDGIIPGSSFSAVQTDDATRSIDFTINSAPVNNGGHASFANVVLSDTGPNGAPAVGAVCTITITVPIPQSTDYVVETGGNPTPSWGTATPILQFDGVDQPVTDEAFGVRVLVDTWTLSPDWDIVSAIGSGGGGGGSGGASTFTELSDTPTDYSASAGKIVTVNDGENGLEFDNNVIGDMGLVGQFVQTYTDFELQRWNRLADGSLNVAWNMNADGSQFTARLHDSIDDDYIFVPGRPTAADFESSVLTRRMGDARYEFKGGSVDPIGKMAGAAGNAKGTSTGSVSLTEQRFDEGIGVVWDFNANATRFNLPEGTYLIEYALPLRTNAVPGSLTTANSYLSLPGDVRVAAVGTRANVRGAGTEGTGSYVYTVTADDALNGEFFIGWARDSANWTNSPSAESGDFNPCNWVRIRRIA